MIRSVRQILKAILKEQLVSDEVLSTVITEAVNILNSRPLTRNSDSPLDEQPLTPNHLFHLRPCPDLPPVFGLFVLAQMDERLPANFVRKEKMENTEKKLGG